jgi:hypothetical protein
VDAALGEPRQQDVQFTIADERFAAHQRHVDRTMAIDRLEHAVDERLALEVRQRPQRLPAAEVLVAVGVAPRTAERAFTGDFNGEIRPVSLEDSPPGRNDAFHVFTLTQGWRPRCGRPHRSAIVRPGPSAISRRRT